MKWSGSGAHTAVSSVCICTHLFNTSWCIGETLTPTKLTVAAIRRYFSSRNLRSKFEKRCASLMLSVQHKRRGCYGVECHTSCCLADNQPRHTNSMGCQNSKPEVIDEPSGTTKAGKANTRVDATNAAVKPVQGRPVEPPIIASQRLTAPSRVCLRRWGLLRLRPRRRLLRLCPRRSRRW